MVNRVGHHNRGHMKKHEYKIVNIQKHKEYIPTVANWIYNEFIAGHIPDCSESDIIEALNNRKISDIPMTFICLEKSGCVGTVSLFSNDLSRLSQFTPWLAALYVAEEYRGRGIARMLINCIEHEAARLGYRKIYLRTETAQDYYSKINWIYKLDIVDENEIITSVYEKVLQTPSNMA